MSEDNALKYEYQELIRIKNKITEINNSVNVINVINDGNILPTRYNRNRVKGIKHNFIEETDQQIKELYYLQFFLRHCVVQLHDSIKLVPPKGENKMISVNESLYLAYKGKEIGDTILWQDENYIIASISRKLNSGGNVSFLLNDYLRDYKRYTEIRKIVNRDISKKGIALKQLEYPIYVPYLILVDLEGNKEILSDNEKNLMVHKGIQLRSDCIFDDSRTPDLKIVTSKISLLEAYFMEDKTIYEYIMQNYAISEDVVSFMKKKYIRNYACNRGDKMRQDADTFLREWEYCKTSMLREKAHVKEVAIKSNLCKVCQNVIASNRKNDILCENCEKKRKRAETIFQEIKANDKSYDIVCPYCKNKSVSLGFYCRKCRNTIGWKRELIKLAEKNYYIEQYHYYCSDSEQSVNYETYLKVRKDKTQLYKALCFDMNLEIRQNLSLTFYATKYDMLKWKLCKKASCENNNFLEVVYVSEIKNVFHIVIDKTNKLIKFDLYINGRKEICPYEQMVELYKSILNNITDAQYVLPKVIELQIQDNMNEILNCVEFEYQVLKALMYCRIDLEYRPPSDGYSSSSSNPGEPISVSAYYGGSCSPR